MRSRGPLPSARGRRSLGLRCLAPTHGSITSHRGYGELLSGIKLSPSASSSSSSPRRGGRARPRARGRFAPAARAASSVPASAPWAAWGGSWPSPPASRLFFTLWRIMVVTRPTPFPRVIVTIVRFFFILGGGPGSPQTCWWPKACCAARRYTAALACYCGACNVFAVVVALVVVAVGRRRPGRSSSSVVVVVVTVDVVRRRRRLRRCRRRRRSSSLAVGNGPGTIRYPGEAPPGSSSSLSCEDPRGVWTFSALFGPPGPDPRRRDFFNVGSPEVPALSRVVFWRSRRPLRAPRGSDLFPGTGFSFRADF